MPIEIGLAVRPAIDQTARDYAKRLKDGLRNGNPSYDADIVEEDDAYSGSKLVVIRIRGASGTPSNYAAMADKFFDPISQGGFGAVVVVTADAIATTPMRDKIKGEYQAVVAAFSANPITFGHTTSLDAPTGRVTGVLVTISGLDADRLQKLRQLLGGDGGNRLGIIRVAPFATPTPHQAKLNECTADEENELRNAATLHGFLPANIVVVSIDRATPNFSLVTGAKANVDGFVVIRDPLFQFTHRQDLVNAINAAPRKPTVFPFKDYFNAGGKDFHGPDRQSGMERAGRQVAAIIQDRLSGGIADVSKLPFIRPKIDAGHQA